MFFHKAADDLTGANQGFFLFLIQRKLPHLVCSVPAYDAQSTGKDTLLAILTGEKGRAGHRPFFIPRMARVMAAAAEATPNSVEPLPSTICQPVSTVSLAAFFKSSSVIFPGCCSIHCAKGWPLTVIWDKAATWLSPCSPSI